MNKQTYSKMKPAKDLDQQLAENAVECNRQNIRVRIDRINSKHNVAYCSVAQLHRGLFRRSRPFPYLVHQAERALAPLRAHGITPMIAVQQRAMQDPIDPAVHTVHPFLIGRALHLWNRLGAPMSRSSNTADPFGWRQALSGSGR